MKKSDIHYCRHYSLDLTSYLLSLDLEVPTFCSNSSECIVPLGIALKVAMRHM